MVSGYDHPENMKMPARHIPTHAFDEILTELGDDPAIPDPHGIRKSRPPSGINPHSIHSHLTQESTDSRTPISVAQIKKIVASLPILVCALGLAIAIFLIYQTLNTTPATHFEDIQLQVAELKKEMAKLQNQLTEIEDELYDEMDKIEVSIHSLRESKGKERNISRVSSNPFESAIQRWKYLGAIQMGGSHQAIFHTEKGRSTIEKGANALGDWHLSHIEKEAATLTNTQGKSLILKTHKGE